MPVLRSVVAAGLAGSALGVTLPLSVAHAAGSGSPGRAAATTAELSLDVRLLNNAVHIPVDVALNKVRTPAQRDGAMLTAKVDGVDGGLPVTLVKAEVGRSTTRADEHGAAATVRLVGAGLHAPGLPLTALLDLDAVEAEASCPVDGPPTVRVTSPSKVTVLGTPVNLGLHGPSHVELPAIGTVDVRFDQRTTTSTTAAATALEATVEVNPLNLNVAKVTGRITLASVGCEKPVPAAATSAAPTDRSPRPSVATTAARAVPAGAELASTGGNGILPLAAGGGTLLLAGGAALWMTRRRRTRARHR